MKKYTKILIPYFFLFISLYGSTIIWEFIKIPFKDLEINGIYSELKYHSLNDPVRYLVFILLPLITWFFSYKLLNNYKFSQLKQSFQLKEIKYSESNFNKIIFYLFLIFLIFEYLSIIFPLNVMDLVHEGQQISSAYKNYLDGELWSSSYITVGIFFETLNSSIIWKLFDQVSFGLFRISGLTYILITKILILIFCNNISKLITSNDFYKSIFFLILVFILVNFVDYDLNSPDYLNYREIPILIGLIFIIKILKKNNLQIINIYFFSLLSLPSLLWGIDRGLIFNFLLLSLVFYFIFSKNFKLLFHLILGVLVFWLIGYFIIGTEFKFFIQNTLSIIKEMNYVHGLIHPTPFSDDPNSSRATKTIILILFCLLFSIKLLFNDNKNYKNNLRMLFIFLSLVSFFSYLYALGRSDGPHIKQTFGYPLIFLIISSLNIAFIYFINKIKKIQTKFSKLFLIIFTFVFSIFIFDINFKNILDYKERFVEYKNQNDSVFLNDKEIKIINKIKPILSNYNCVQLFSNDTALLYLLRSKSCSKYYFVWSTGSKKNQQELVSKLTQKHLIIYGGDSMNWDMPLNIKLPYFASHLEKNYKLLFEQDNYKVFEN